MSNLTSTAPAAFDNFLLLITAAASGEDIAVIDSELLEYEPGTYIELTGIAEHIFTPATLGYTSFQEEYILTGAVRVYMGGAGQSKAVRDAAWAAFQAYVMTTVVNNRQLGVTGPSSTTIFCVPHTASYATQVVSAGWQGLLDFGFRCVARITVGG